MRRLRSAVVPGASLPDGNFYVSMVYIQKGHEGVLFIFPEAGSMGVCLAKGDQICGWTLTDWARAKQDTTDGYAVLKSSEGKSLELWQHVPPPGFGLAPRKMPYSQWVHHENQLDAVISRAAHSICVRGRPDGGSDELRDEADPMPLGVMPPSAPAAKSPEATKIRGRIQVELGRRLFDRTALPNVDLYVADIVTKAKCVTYRFTNARGVWVVASVGDNIAGWILTDFREDPATGDQGAVMKLWYADKTIEFWKRLEIPKPGEVLRLSQTSWERHQFEPEMERLRAEGRIVVIQDSQRPSTKPAN